MPGFNRIATREEQKEPCPAVECLHQKHYYEQTQDMSSSYKMTGNRAVIVASKKCATKVSRVKRCWLTRACPGCQILTQLQKVCGATMIRKMSLIRFGDGPFHPVGYPWKGCDILGMNIPGMIRMVS
jgi:hypothetical protein